MDNNSHEEVKNQIVISADDCQNVREYGKHFGVPIPQALEDALDAFVEAQTFENQQSVKLEMCKWMLTSEHESFQDKLWEEPKQLAEEATFNLQFDKDVQDALDQSNTTEETD